MQGVLISKGAFEDLKKSTVRVLHTVFQGTLGFRCIHITRTSKHVAENIQEQGFLKLERLSFSTLKMSQNVFFVQRTNHKLGNAISMYLPHDPIFKQWGKMCDLQTLSRCDWGVLHDMISKFVQGRVVA